MIPILNEFDDGRYAEAKFCLIFAPCELQVATCNYRLLVVWAGHHREVMFKAFRDCQISRIQQFENIFVESIWTQCLKMKVSL